MTDKKLVKVVHREELTKGRTLTAMITRFGTLEVFIWDEEGECLWQGQNILEARTWAAATPHRKQEKKRHA